jgi:hypothetical protein
LDELLVIFFITARAYQLNDYADDAEVIRTPIAKILNNDAGKPVG